jgi:hypothetical protein
MSETDTSNVTPLRPEKKDVTAAARARRYRERRKTKRREKTASRSPILPVTLREPAAEIVQLKKPSDLNKGVTVVTPSGRTNWALVAIAYGFFALGIGINIWNASTGAITDMALPAALGVLAEAVVFFLPVWALTLPIGRQVLAWALFIFVSVFALTNSLRMASIIAADQATIRADRQTEGVRTADHALEAARAMRDQACGRGLGKTIACRNRQAEVTALEAKQSQAVVKVAAQARPESTDFAKLVTWVSRGTIQPGADDFTMLFLLFRVFLPSIGGFVLMLSRR